MVLPPIYEHRFVILFGGHVFTMFDSELFEGYDHGCVVDLFDCIKDSAMNRVGYGSGIILGETEFKCIDRGVAIIVNSCSCRVFDATLLVLTLGVAVFDAIAKVGRLLGVGRTYVVHSTRFYLRVDSF